MANNILTGEVKITAPGVAQTFNQVAEGAKKTETALKNIGTSTTSSASAITTLGNSLKAGASNFTIIGEAGVRAGSQLRSLSGVLNTTASSVPALTQATAGLGQTVLSTALAFGGAGLAAKILTGVAGELATALFGDADAFSQVDLNAATFAGTLRDLKSDLDAFKDNLDFSEKINNINNQLKGLSGTALSIANAGNKGIDDAKTIDKINDQIDILKKLQENLVKGRLALENTVAKVGAGSELAKLLRTGINLTDINGNLLKGLADSDQTLVKQYQDTNKRIQELQKERGSISKDITLLSKQQQLDIYNQQQEDAKKAAEEQKKLNAKSASDYERYVNETIAQAKKVSNVFKEGISIRLNIKPLDTKSEEFKKSLAFLKDFDSSNFSFTIVPKIDVKNIEHPAEDVKAAALTFGQMFTKELDAYFKNVEPTDFTLIAAVQEDKKQKFDFKGLEKLSEEQNKIIRQTAELTSIISQPFDAMVDAIGRGENAFKAFGEGVKGVLIGVIKKLVETAILALALSALFPGGVGGAKGFGAIFGKLFGFGGKAVGGNVSAGEAYPVGERGVEIFKPNTGGRILSHNEVLGMSGRSVAGGMKIQIAGQFELQGQNLVAAVTLANQSKARLQ